MLAAHEAAYALDCLLDGGLDDAERQRLRRELGDFIENVTGDIQALETAHRHEASESARHFADASQKDKELRTLRGAVDQSRGELAELTDATTKLLALLESRPMTADVFEAVAAVRIAMQGQQARRLAIALADSVRKFDALTIMHKMLRKLRVSEDVYRAADEWAKKRLRF